MLAKLKNMVAKLSNEEREEICNYLKDKSYKLDAKLKDVLFKILDVAYDTIKENPGEENYVYEIFGDDVKVYLMQMLKSRVQLFNDFAVLRFLEKEKIITAQYLIDMIWKEFIVRYNPNFEIIDIDGVTAEAVSSCMDALEFLSDSCIRNMFSYDAIVSKVKDTTGLSSELCNYIAQKINGDFGELRANYIIKRLYTIEKLMQEK